MKSAAALVLLAAPMVPTASAAEVDIETCASVPSVYSAMAGPAAWVETYGPSAVWNLAIECPYQMVLGMAGVAAQNASSYWRYPAESDATVPIIAAEFGLSGSDGSDSGSQQGVRVCTQNGACGPLVKPSGSAVETPERFELSVADGEIPPNADHIEIGARCERASGCSPGRTLVIDDFQFTVADDFAPSVELITPDVTFDEEHPPPLSLGTEDWNALKRGIYFRATDGESGVRKVTLRIGTRQVTVPSGCGADDYPLTTRLCERDWNGLHVLMLNDLFHAGMVSGANLLELAAYDAAGNKSVSVQTSFKADTTAPSFSGLHVTGPTLNGWQTKPSMQIAWTNQAEDPSKQSPVSSALVTVTPADGQQFAPSRIRVNKAPTQMEVNSANGLVIPAAGRWIVSVMTYDAAGNKSVPHEITVGYDSVLLDAPELTVQPVVGAAALSAGLEIGWLPPANAGFSASGICGYAVALDRRSDGDPGETLRTSAGRPFWQLPEILPSGTNYLHVRGVTCSGVIGRVGTLAFEVDAIPPAISVSGPGESGWYDEGHPPGFTATDPGGGVDHVSYSIDGGPEVPLQTSAAAVPLGQGRHQVTLKAVDDVGNESVVQREFNFDDAAPVAWFNPADQQRPTLITANVRDAGSGVASVAIEYRSALGGEWQQLGRPANGPSSASIELTSRIPDAYLDDGLYELRVVAVDAAGHSSTSGIRLDGQPAAFSIPLRAKSALTSGFLVYSFRRECDGRGANRRCHAVRVEDRNRRTSRWLANYAEAVRMSGLLTDATGIPVADEKLDVFEIVASKSRRRIAGVVTDSTGRYEYAVPTGCSRQIVIRYPGSERLAPVESVATLNVRSKVTLRASARRIKRRGSIEFRGRVFSVGAVIPSSGKKVLMEYRVGNTWKLFGNGAVADLNGRFKAMVRLNPPGTASVKFRVRARVPWEDGWVYEDGASAPVDFFVAAR